MFDGRITLVRFKIKTICIFFGEYPKSQSSSSHKIDLKMTSFEGKDAYTERARQV